VSRLLALDDIPFDLVVIDDLRAPRRLRRWLDRLAERAELRHITLRHHAGVNEARMHAFAQVQTQYVLFIDNDAFLHDGSLGRLLECAEQTGAAFVAPLYLEGTGEPKIHFAGGTARIVDSPAGPRLVEDRPFAHARHADVAEQLERRPCDVPEMHGVLVRSDALRRVGGLDTALQSSMDCLDLGFRLRDAEGGGWFEPAALITYDDRRPVPSDLRLYMARWSRRTTEGDIDRFAEQWGLDAADPGFHEHRGVLRQRCVRPYRYARGAVRRLLGDGPADRVDRAVEAVVDRVLL
jgi:glycosyltransferase involved in cell wall biosynthesis